MAKRATRSINSSWLLAAAISICPTAGHAGPGIGDTATGQYALTNENGGTYNTADGYYALNQNATGNYNTATGASSLGNNTTGNNNTANGESALILNTTGSYNTASGAVALSSNNGSFNAAFGYAALQSNTTGNYNTASGTYALISNSTGGGNTATGAGALYHNTTGYFNTASGEDALNATTTGKQNTAAGVQALYANIAGSNNVAVGAYALLALKGNNNIALGTGAGKLTTSGSANIYIGHPGISGAESAVIRIGAGQTKTFIAGIAKSPMSGATVVVKSNGQLGVVASSARYKMDIEPLGDASDKLAQLRPVTYRYKAEPGATHYGLIAEEVDKVMPELVVRDEQSRPESVQYQELVPLLLQQVKLQRALIERLEARVDDLSRSHFANNAASRRD